MQHPFRGDVSPPPPDAEGGALLTSPGYPQQPAKLDAANRQNLTPHRAGFATLTGRESAAESEPESAANRTRITARIGGSSPTDSATGSARRQDGKAAPQIGAARTPNHG